MQDDQNIRLSPPMVRKLTQVVELGFSLASRNDEAYLALMQKGLVKQVGPNRQQKRWLPTEQGLELAKQYQLGATRAWKGF